MFVEYFSCAEDLIEYLELWGHLALNSADPNPFF